MQRCRSLASSLELISGAFKKHTEEMESPKSPQSLDTDTATTSETGYESRPPTDKVLKEQPELLESRDLDAVLGAIENQAFGDDGERRQFITQINEARTKLRRQAMLM